MPSSSRRTRKAARSAGSCSGKRHARGLWANSCTESIPNECAFSSAFLIPPEQWPPRSMPPTLPEPRFEAGALVLEVAPGRGRQRRERLGHNSLPLDPPDAGHVAVDRKGRLDVRVLAHHERAVLVGEDALPVDQDVVELRQ